jgi:exosortase
MMKAEATVERRIMPGQPIIWIVFCGAFLAAYLPVLTGLIHVWISSDDYSHGLAIIPLAVYILWQKRGALLTTPVKGAWPGFLLATASLIVYVFAKIGEIQSLSSVSMIIFLWGAVIFLFGYEIFKVSLFPLLVLFFMIPVPAQIIAALTIPLQLIVTKASVLLASMTGVPVFHEGNIINVPRGTFQVVQACSGLRSIMTMLTLGAVLAYLTLRSNFLRSILFVLAVPIAIAVNILRVFLLVVAFQFLGIDLSEGTPHTLLGLAVFVIAVGLFLLTRKGLALCER